MRLIQKIALVAALAFAGTASASTLFWQIDQETAERGYKGDDAAYAVLHATQTGSSADKAIVVAGYDLSEGTAWSTDLGTYGSSDYSFFVELLNNSGTSVFTQASPVSYDSLVSSGYVSATALSVPAAALTGGFNGASVPEPTSGVLLLIGGAMLALRRRRRA